MTPNLPLSANVGRHMDNGASAVLEKTFRDWECSGPVPLAAIAEAEVTLGVAFPPVYRQFLSQFGAALGKDRLEIYGLVYPTLGPDDHPHWCEVVPETLSSGVHGEYPGRYFAVSHDGIECGYYVDTLLRSEKGENPVVALGPGRDFEPVAASFLEFAQLASRGVKP